jgi:Flp pilus assembly pilin Flp
MIIQKIRKGQSVVEYTVLIIIVGAALVAMSTYIMRSMNARLKQAQDELNYYKKE